MFITLAGPDCSGKSTQAQLLVKWLQSSLNMHVMHLAFPTSSPAGVAVRKLLSLDKLFVLDAARSDLPAVILQSAFVADRYGTVGSIRACVRGGGFVVAERWAECGFVYGLEEGLDGDWLSAVNASLPEPDLNILIDVDADTVLARLRERGGVPERYDHRDAQHRILQRYRRLWMSEIGLRNGVPTSNGNPAWKIVDGRPPIEVTAEAIRDLVIERRRSWGF